MSDQAQQPVSQAGTTEPANISSATTATGPESPLPAADATKNDGDKAASGGIPSETKPSAATEAILNGDGQGTAASASTETSGPEATKSYVAGDDLQKAGAVESGSAVEKKLNGSAKAAIVSTDSKNDSTAQAAGHEHGVDQPVEDESPAKEDVVMKDADNKANDGSDDPPKDTLAPADTSDDAKHALDSTTGADAAEEDRPAKKQKTATNKTDKAEKPVSSPKRTASTKKKDTVKSDAPEVQPRRSSRLAN